MWLWPACTTIEMEALYGFITTPPHTSRRIEPLNAVKTGQINTKSSRVAKNAGRGSSQKKGLTPAEKRATSKRLNPSQQKRSGNKSRQTSPPSKPAVKKVIGDFAAEEFEYGISAAQGLRETMEDEAVVFESGKCGYMYAMVLDGHDGMLSVQWLADRLFDIFSSVTDNGMYSGMCDLDLSDPETGLCCPINLTPTLTEMFHEADNELLEHLKGMGGLKAARSGSTATVALIKKDRLVVANVGDSRLVLCRNGRAMDLTTEHRLYGKGPTVKAEIERVKSVGGWVEDGRVCGLLAVSRAFGDWELKEEGMDHFLKESLEYGFITESFAKTVKFTGSPVVATPDVTELRLNNTDEFVIMASDGIWDVMSSSDAIRLAKAKYRKGCSSQEIADYLCEIALKRYTSDNVACVVINLGNKEQGQSSS